MSEDRSHIPAETPLTMELLHSPFRPFFDEFCDHIQADCLICSPYVTLGPARRLVETIHGKNLQDTISVSVLTDISTPNIVQGATDVAALLYLTENLSRVRITYLPRIHAKVYVCDDSLAIVTSANFTDGGAEQNLEYGVRIQEPRIIQAIRNDIGEYTKLGSLVEPLRLRMLLGRVQQVRDAIRDEQKAIRQQLRSLSAEIERATEDDLIRIRVENRSIHAIFAETILYLLSYRDMTTAELNARTREIHPDLCDDTTDRVIDGKRYGKLWTHQVRSAQVTLRLT